MRRLLRSLVAAPAAAPAAASAPTLATATVGAPVVLPDTAMFDAFATTSAARFRLPDTRMPASPASIVPDGAIQVDVGRGRGSVELDLNAGLVRGKYISFSGGIGF